MAKDYYFRLGVHHDASQSRIAVMYQGQMHDLEKSGCPERPIRDAEQAYSIVGHPPRRLLYDKVLSQREPGLQHEEVTVIRPHGESQAQSGSPADLGEVSLTRSFRTFAPSFEQILDRLWANFTGVARPKAEMAQSLTIEIPITARQATTGGTAQVLIPVLAPCPVCRGHGGVGGFLCWQCDGRGRLAMEEPVAISFPGATRNTQSKFPWKVSVSTTST